METVDTRADRIRNLLSLGDSVRTIADKLEMGESVVRRVIRDSGLPRPGSRRGKGFQNKRHPSPAERAIAIQVANEQGAHRAARLLGVHERTIVRWRNGHLKKAAR